MCHTNLSNASALQGCWSLLKFLMHLSFLILINLTSFNFSEFFLSNCFPRFQFFPEVKTEIYTAKNLYLPSKVALSTMMITFSTTPSPQPKVLSLTSKNYYRERKIRRNMLTANPMQGQVRCCQIWGRLWKRGKNHISGP